jgi:hypothetical protein
MELFQGDGGDGHSLLGAAVHEAVARLRAARGEEPGSRWMIFARPGSAR